MSMLRADRRGAAGTHTARSMCRVCELQPSAGMQGVVRTLMKFGMEVNRCDASGKSALDVARQRAKGNENDPLVSYMTRAIRLQALQKQGRQRRRTESSVKRS